ncbi:MAG: TonB-dependent receptor plug domain-containing protein [Bacteroidota bacterium]
MKHYKGILAGAIVALFMCSHPNVNAQTDSIFALDSVEINAQSLRAQNISGHQQHWNTKQLEAFSGGGLDQVLAQQTGVFVKSYGGGSLATTSIRGGSAGQTAVIWNGLPIQSPMLGQLDMSLLPIGFVDELSVQYGGNSAMWGSGAIGGTILLNNQFRLERATKVQYLGSIGSFGQQSHQVGAQWANQKFGVRTRVLNHLAENDFWYTVRDDLPQKQQTHARLDRQGLMQEVFWKPNAKQSFSAHFWAQDNFREIPPTTVQTRSEATQADKALRLSLNWQRLGKNSILKTRVGLFRENLLYLDPPNLIESNSQFRTLISEVEQTHYLKGGHQLTSGIHYQWTDALSGAYVDPVQQQNLAVFVQDQFAIKHWQFLASIRQQFSDFELLPTVWNAEFKRSLGANLNLSGKVSRNYRLPTLNDQYWFPGGNPDLKAEQGYSQELGLLFHRLGERSSLDLQVFAYNRNIQNWIMWGVAEGDNFWSAQNITEVWSRGLESRFAYTIKRSAQQLYKIQAGYDYTRSTNQVAIEVPRTEAGSQLLYVPIHQAFAGLSWQWQELKLSYQHRYTSSISTVNVPTLEGYHLGYAQIGYRWQVAQFSGYTYLNIDNVFNRSYRVVERRAMPGRAFRFGFSLNWQHPHS